MRFVKLRDGTARRIVKPGQVFNRIHVDDMAGALWQLAQGKLGGIFNLSDDEPAPPQDVVAYAAALMGVEPPPEIPFETAQLSPMARSFYGENKRVANAAHQGGRLSLSLSRLSRRLRPYVGERRLARRRGAQPDEALSDRSIVRCVL